MSPAPALNGEEAAIWERFEAAPVLPESHEGEVEAVARAIADTLGHKDPDWYFEFWGDLYRRYAVAAIQTLAARRPATEAEDAVERVRKLLAFYDRHEYASLNVDDLRAALDPS